MAQERKDNVSVANRASRGEVLFATQFRFSVEELDDEEYNELFDTKAFACDSSMAKCKQNLTRCCCFNIFHCTGGCAGTKVFR